MRVLSLRRPIDVDGPIGRTSRFSNGNGRGLYRNPRKHTAIRGGLARRRVLRAARMNGLIRVDDHRGTQTRHVQKQKRCQQDGQSEFRSALHTPCRIACTPRATNPRSNIPHGFAPLSTRRFRSFGLKHTLKWGNFPADLADSGHSFRSDAGRRVYNRLSPAERCASGSCSRAAHV